MDTRATAILRSLIPPRTIPEFPVRAWRLARRKPLGAVCLAVLIVLVFAAVGAESVAPFDPELPVGDEILMPPLSTNVALGEGVGGAFLLLGSDWFARDVLSRIIYGARISLWVGFLSVAVGTLLGSLFGLVSGYVGGRFDLTVQRFMDSMLSIPTIVLALVIVAALGVGLTNIIVAIGISQVPQINRVVRGAVIAEKENVYVEAARAIGCGEGRIIGKHILPNVTAPIIIMATVTIAGAILQEAGLSFLGVGVPENIPSWGVMLSGKAVQSLLAQPWLAVWPGLAITLSVLAWNLFGDALRDVLDPRLRGSR